jgi:hypothetical protein
MKYLDIGVRPEAISLERNRLKRAASTVRIFIPERILMKLKHYLPVAFGALSTIANAQGLNFESSKSVRFTDSKDSKVGLTSVDAAQNITWMRCAVDQKFDEVSKVCNGEAAKVTFLEATAFAKKIGNGWRLPTYWEAESARGYVMKILARGVHAPSGTYGGGGWDCEYSDIWTSTDVKDQPNQVGTASCQGFTSGNTIKFNEVERHGNYRAQLILVKDK